MSLDINQLLADKLENVLKQLEQNNYAVDTLETVPFMDKKGQGSKRVLSVKKITPERVLLIWSYENYH